MPFEMQGPSLSPRVKQRHDFPCDGVNAAQITGFEKVAKMARPAGIAQAVKALVLASNDVLDMKREVEHIGLADLTVFTTIARAPAHELSSPSTCHFFPLERWANARAWACSNARNSAANTFISYSARSSGVKSSSLHLRASVAIRRAAALPARILRRACAASAFRLRATGSMIRSKTDVDVATAMLNSISQSVPVVAGDRAATTWDKGVLK